jgi:hypothetical protein
MTSYIVFLFLIGYISAQLFEGKFSVNIMCGNFLTSYLLQYEVRVLSIMSS